MSRYADRAQMTSTTTGTGTLTLVAATPKYRTFSAAGVLNTESVNYLIEDGSAWELGVGTYSSSGTTLTRSLRSSSSGSLLNCSGSQIVSVVAAGSDFSGFEVDRWFFSNFGAY